MVKVLLGFYTWKRFIKSLTAPCLPNPNLESLDKERDLVNLSFNLLFVYFEVLYQLQERIHVPTLTHDLIVQQY